MVHFVQFGTAFPAARPERRPASVCRRSPETGDVFFGISRLEREIRRVEREQPHKMAYVAMNSDVTLRGWLDQFETREEKRLALKLFEHYRLIGQRELRDGLQKQHEWLRSQPGFDPETTNYTYFGFGKSGGLIHYFYRQANREEVPTESGLEFSRIGDPPPMTPGRRIETLVILDDFLGTGREAHWHFRVNKEALQRYKNVYFLPIVAFDEGVDLLTKEHPEVTVHPLERHPKFSSDDFPGFSKAEKGKIRDLLVKYGSNLYPTDRLPPKSLKPENRVASPFGYRDSEAMVGFEYNTPSNTFPIFWSRQNGWKPIFPRYDSYDYFRKSAYAPGFL